MTANQRFKRMYTGAFGISLVLASAATLLMFVYFPAFTSGNVSFAPQELQEVQLPPEVKIPPPPKRIARPAAPIVGNATVNDTITIAPTTFEKNPVSSLPPPPTTAADGAETNADISSAPVFTPFTVAPHLLNTAAVQKALVQDYPPTLREAGISGSVLVWFLINQHGVVEKTKVETSSGYPAMDKAALEIAPLMRFTPARNRDNKVEVWVSLPVTFKAG